MIKDVLSGLAIGAFVSAIALFASEVAFGADEYLCVLWARENVRINLDASTDPAIERADLALILKMEERSFNTCLLFETDKPALPNEPARTSIVWARQMLKLVKIQPGTVPAGEEERLSCEKGSCLAIGSTEWKDFCREHWPRTYREEDDTVIRPGSSERVPCPA